VKRFRERVKSTVYGSLIWRVSIGVVGGVITVAGVLMFFLPGPGLLVLVAGLGMLATEFAWAATALRRTRDIAAAASKKVRIPLWIKYAMATGVTLLSILVILHRYVERK
jgi:uncharacterized protein (TIGR02611 family)